MTRSALGKLYNVLGRANNRISRYYRSSKSPKFLKEIIIPASKAFYYLLGSELTKGYTSILWVVGCSKVQYFENKTNIWLKPFFDRSRIFYKWHLWWRQIYQKSRYNILWTFNKLYKFLSRLHFIFVLDSVDFVLDIPFSLLIENFLPTLYILSVVNKI